jgi:hypothetical protein
MTWGVSRDFEAASIRRAHGHSILQAARWLTKTALPLLMEAASARTRFGLRSCLEGSQNPVSQEYDETNWYANDRRRDYFRNSRVANLSCDLRALAGAFIGWVIIQEYLAFPSDCDEISNPRFAADIWSRNLERHSPANFSW